MEKSRISFEVAPAAHKRLKQIADETKVKSVPDVCRTAIDFYLICHEAKRIEGKEPALIAEDGSVERVRGFV